VGIAVLAVVFALGRTPVGRPVLILLAFYIVGFILMRWLAQLDSRIQARRAGFPPRGLIVLGGVTIIFWVVSLLHWMVLMFP